MTSRHTLATLTVDGWVNQSIQVIDQMLSDFFLSEYSQTFAFTDNVASFSWILQQYRDNLDTLTGETQRRLTDYLTRQFNEVEVIVEHKLNDDSINTHSLFVFMSVRDMAGEEFTLTRVAKHNGLKVNEINKILSGEA